MRHRSSNITGGGSLLAIALLLVGCGPGESKPEYDCTVPGSVCTVAGTGAHGFNDDGKAADKTWLYFPTAVRFFDDGTPLIVDFNNLRIRAIDGKGRIETLAGSGFHAFAKPGDALTSPLENPIDAWPTPDGGFVAAELHAARILKVTADGQLSILAGDGTVAYSGDGGPAVDATLSEVVGVTVADDGRVFIADTDNHCIRVIDPATGIIDSIAGSGQPGLLDGDLLDARFDGPQHMAWLDGDLLVADRYNHMIRRVDLDAGEVSAVAGSGIPGFSGDGGSAVDAQLSEPQGVAVGPDGSIWIADSANHVVRRVDPDGAIWTEVGVGGQAGDGPKTGDVADALLNLPNDVEVGPDGNVWIADTLNSQVRVYVPVD